MKLAPHRTVPNRAREQKERVAQLVREQLQGRKICDTCGATFGTYADHCEADLGASCPGSRAIADAFKRAGQRVGVA